MASLTELERKIAELEKEVSLSEDDHEADARGEDEIDLSPIPPLPAALLPPPGLFRSTLKRDKAAKATNERPDPTRPENPVEKTKEQSKRVECSTCCEWFQGDEAYRKHTRTLKHRQNVILKAGAAYEPARHEANYCRACEIKFDSVELLLAHRKTQEHKDATERLMRASYCQLCKKQFTSPVQLRGHILGKAHNDLIEIKTGYRPVPLSDTQQTRRNHDDASAAASATVPENGGGHLKRQRKW